MKKGRSRTLQSTKYLQKKQKRLKINLILISVCALAFVGLIILILRLPFLQISAINVSGVKTLSADEVRTKALESIKGNYFNLIPKSNAIFYSEKDMDIALKGTFKKIHSITFERKDISTLNLVIAESIPNAIVCEGFREEENQEKCFFVDSNGYVFEKATQFSDGVYSKYYVNHDTNPIAIGKTFLEKEKYVELQKFVTNTNRAGISTAGILVGDSGSYELYVKNKDDSVTVVYFDDRIPFDKTLSNFLAFWQSALDNKLGDRKSGTSGPPIFDYINLRFGNNIFYVTK